MSIKHFSNQFCATCQRDTTHFVCKCRECGTVKESPTEARQRVSKRMAVRAARNPNLRYRMNVAKGLANRAQREAQAHLPTGALHQRRKAGI